MKSPYEKYEVVAQVKVGFNLDNVEELMQDLVQLLASHGILCSGDKFKANIVADQAVIIALFCQGEGGVC